jgi:C4-dicarboxylate transporter
LTPIILSLLLIALIAITAGSGAAPFIYTLF